jgi:hypothetical protein
MFHSAAMARKSAEDWSAIETPAGRATKVPAHLEGLSAKDPKARAKSLTALRRLAIFEGDITPLAVPLAPQLVAIAKDPKAPELAGVLLLLADLLVCGSADTWIKIGYEVRIPAFENAAPDQYGRALYERIAVGAETYASYVTHANAVVRAHVAPLLAYSSRETKLIEPALLAQLPKEKDAAARGALAIALAHQGRYQKDERATKALLAQSQEKDPLARLGAAVGLAVTLGAKAGDDVAETLLDAAKRQRKKVDAFPWYRGSCANLAVVVCAHLAERRRDLDLAERLVVAAAELPTHFWALGSLIDAAFAGDERSTPRAPGELDAKQKKAVLQVAATEQIERLGPGLARAGLPDDADALACVAGKPPKTALARVVDGESLLRSAVCALRTAAAQAKWHAKLASMTDDERIEIARDAHCHPLRIWSLPRPVDLDPERDEFVIDDRADRALLGRAMELIATDLMGCAPDALAAELARLGKQDLQPPGYLYALTGATCEAFARAGREVPKAVDRRFERINPGDVPGDIELLRSAIEKLPPKRREAVILEQHFWHHGIPEPGEAPLGGAWLTVDLAPTAAIAKHVVKEILSWSGESAPYPEDHAVRVLQRIGVPARAPIKAGLTKSPAYAGVLERALAGLAE